MFLNGGVMDRNLIYPVTTTSYFIAETPLTGFKPVENVKEFLFTDRNGEPGVHPSMPNGRILVAQLKLASGKLPAWVCNNVGTMRKLWLLAGDVQSGVTTIQWFTGHYTDLDARPCRVGVTWAGGWDDYMVDPTSCRDMTPDELKQTEGNGRYSPTVAAANRSRWLRCDFAGPVFSLVGPNQVVQITERLGSGD